MIVRYFTLFSMTNLLFEALIRVYLERFRLTGRIGTDRPGMMR